MEGRKIFVDYRGCGGCGVNGAGANGDNGGNGVTCDGDDDGMLKMVNGC